MEIPAHMNANRRLAILLAAILSLVPSAAANDKVVGVITELAPHIEGDWADSVTVKTSTQGTVTIAVTKKTKARALGANGRASKTDLDIGDHVLIDVKRDRAGLLVANEIAWEPHVEFVPEDIASEDQESLAQIVLSGPRVWASVDGKHLNELATKVYVRPGAHHIVFEWGDMVWDRRTFNNTKLEADKQVQTHLEGFVVTGAHWVTKLVQEEDVMVTAGESKTVEPHSYLAKPPAK